jgi:sugar lactone lactonase YvrE
MQSGDYAIGSYNIQANSIYSSFSGSYPGTDSSMTVTPDATRAVFINASTNASFSVFDYRTDSFTATSATFTSGSAPAALAVTPNSKAVWVTDNGLNQIQKFDLATGTLLTTITGITSPSSIVLSPDGTTAYIGDSTSGVIYQVTLASSTVSTLTTLPSASQNSNLAITPDATTLLSSGSNGTYAVDISSGAATPIAGLATTGGQVVLLNNSSGYAIAGTSGQIVPLDLSSGTSGTAFTPGTSGDTLNLTAAPDGNTLYIADTSNNTLYSYAVSTSTLSTLTTIPYTPDQSALSP